MPPITVLLTPKLCFFLSSIMLLILTGCEQNSTEKQFQTYHQRLANVLDINVTPPLKTNAPFFPESRQLQQPLNDIRYSLLDAYDLRQCGLFQLIAERNSILGKVQDKTRFMRYELLFLQGLDYCLTTLPIDNELRPELEIIYQQKQQQLPRVLWNMVFTEKEWRQQFNIGHQLIINQQYDGYIESINAFHYLADLSLHLSQNVQQTSLARLNKKDIDLLLHHQQQIHKIEYFGQLLYSMARTTTLLTTITNQLVENENVIICGENINPQQAQYLRNIFNKFYAKDLQRYIANLDSQYQTLQPHLKVLYDNLQNKVPSISEPMQRYIAYAFQGQLYQQYQQANREHIQYWQRLFKRCQLKFGNQ